MMMMRSGDGDAAACIDGSSLSQLKEVMERTRAERERTREARERRREALCKERPTTQTPQASSRQRSHGKHERKGKHSKRQGHQRKHKTRKEKKKRQSAARRAEEERGQETEAAAEAEAGDDEQEKQEQSLGLDQEEDATVRAALAAKAALYDKLMHSEPTDGNVASAERGFLVDFNALRAENRREAAAVSPAASSPDRGSEGDESGESDGDDRDWSEIEDEYGRTRKLKRSSSLYKQLRRQRALLGPNMQSRKRARTQDNEQASHTDGHGHEPDTAVRQGHSSKSGSSNREDSGRGMAGDWAWSTGREHARDGTGENVWKQEHNAKRLVREAATAHTADAPSILAARAGKVQTQWEQVLDSSAQALLREGRFRVSRLQRKDDHGARPAR